MSLMKEVVISVCVGLVARLLQECLRIHHSARLAEPGDISLHSGL